MKKVVCIDSGQQKNEPKVKVGEVYTVVEALEAWELMVETGEFYVLAEMGRANAFRTTLFVELESDTIKEVCENKETVSKTA